MANLVLDCGKSGVSFAYCGTLAEEIKFKKSTVRSIERSLRNKGYLLVFEHKGIWYRSPWVAEAQAFIESHSPKDTTSSEETTIARSVPQHHELQEIPLVPQSPSPRYGCDSQPDLQTTLKPAPQAVDTTCPQAPIKTLAPKEQVQKSCTAVPPYDYPVDNLPKPAPQEGTAKKVINQEFNRQRTDTTSTDLFKKPKDKKRNPFSKNRNLVKVLVDDLADRLNAWDSWKYLAKIVWNLREDLEMTLYEAVSWVLEEQHCNRCYSKVGLFDWYLKDKGIHPLKA